MKQKMAIIFLLVALPAFAQYDNKKVDIVKMGIAKGERKLLSEIVQNGYKGRMNRIAVPSGMDVRYDYSPAPEEGMKLDKVAGGSATNIGMQFKDAILNYQTGVSDSNNVITMNPRDTLAFYEGGAQVLKQGNMFQYDCNFTYPDWADAKHLQFRIFYMKNMDTTLNIAQIAEATRQFAVAQGEPYVGSLFLYNYPGQPDVPSATSKELFFTARYVDSTGSPANGPLPSNISALRIPDSWVDPANPTHMNELSIGGSGPWKAWYDSTGQIKCEQKEFLLGYFTRPDTVVPAGPAITVFSTMPNAYPHYSTSTLNFGKVIKGQVKKDSVSISNAGSDTLSVTSISCTNSAFSVAMPVWILAPGNGTYLVVTFAPSDTAAHYGKVMMTFNGVGSPDSSLALNGSGTLTGVKQQPGQIPDEFSLSQNYPNPFNPTTVISYDLSTNSYVTLKVYDMLGREIATLVDGKQSAGSHNATFNAANFPSGVYLYRFQTETYTNTKKLLLLK